MKKANSIGGSPSLPITYQIAVAAVIAALYASLSAALAPFSFGTIQVRVAEALTILPVFMPAAIPGLILGCAIANLIGVMMSVNIAGALDIAIGSAATLLAAIFTWLLRNIRIKNLPVLSFLPPVIFNMFIIGGELSLAQNLPFWLTAAQVGIGQIISCIGLGIPLYIALAKSKFTEKLYQKR